MDEPSSYCAPEKLAEAYIQHIRANITTVGLRFKNRDKNLETLKRFNITTVVVSETVMGLGVANYSHCREAEQGSSESAWVFGVEQFGEEVYVKLKTKRLSTGEEFTICVSYHVAEYPLAYPYAGRSSGRQRGA